MMEHQALSKEDLEFLKELQKDIGRILEKHAATS
jgi:hypothetical protein